MPSNSQVHIVVNSIIGSEFGGKRVKGLVNFDGNEFDTKLVKLEKKKKKTWPPEFVSYTFVWAERGQL